MRTSGVQDSVQKAVECMLRLQECDLVPPPTAAVKPATAGVAAASPAAGEQECSYGAAEAAGDGADAQREQLRLWNEALPATLQSAEMQVELERLEEANTSCHTLATACRMMCTNVSGGRPLHAGQK